MKAAEPQDDPELVATVWALKSIISNAGAALGTIKDSDVLSADRLKTLEGSSEPKS